MSKDKEEDKGPIDVRTGKVHKGYKNLKSWKPGQSGNPKGKVPGTLSYKNRLKRDLKVMNWAQKDPELASLIDSLDNMDMFNALKTTAFAQFVQNPSDEEAYKRAYQAVAEDRQYTEGKVIRQEVNQTITQVSEMTIEELEAELVSFDNEELDPPGANAQVEGSDFDKED